MQSEISLQADISDDGQNVSVVGDLSPTKLGSATAESHSSLNNDIKQNRGEFSGESLLLLKSRNRSHLPIPLH